MGGGGLCPGACPSVTTNSVYVVCANQGDEDRGHVVLCPCRRVYVCICVCVCCVAFFSSRAIFALSCQTRLQPTHIFFVLSFLR